MLQATNYTSGLNRRAKAHTQRWVVRVRYADSTLDTQYLYRTEAGARAKADWYKAAMADSRKYGYQDCPIIAVETVEFPDLKAA